MDVILPVKNRGQLRMRLVARPDKPVAELLAHLGLALPTSPKIIENVVGENRLKWPAKPLKC